MQAVRYVALALIAALGLLASASGWAAPQANPACEAVTELTQKEVPAGSVVLVVPVLQQGKAYKLWEDDNPWYRSWKAALTIKEEKTILLPLGDIDDMKQVSPDAAHTGNYRVLKSLAKKYGAKSILLAEAENTGSGAKVSLRQIGGGVFTARQENYDGTPEVAMPEAVEAMIAYIQDDLRTGKTEIVNQAQVNVGIASLADWQLIQKKLEDVELFRGMETKEIAVSRVKISLAYAGDIESFSASLLQHKMALTLEEDGWSLRLEGVAQTPVPAPGITTDAPAAIPAAKP